jgi:hypothetical protein
VACPSVASRGDYIEQPEHRFFDLQRVLLHPRDQPLRKAALSKVDAGIARK